jgi:AcrR family transcriptional regulator
MTATAREGFMQGDAPSDGPVAGAGGSADQDRLPLALQRLWRRSAPTPPPEPDDVSRARRGRPPLLGVHDIVAAAVRLADSAGVRAVTITAVAADLGVSPMGLYRHVSSKQELLLLVQDEGAGDPPAVDLPSQQWREGLRRGALALREVHHRRPWLARLPVTGPPSGPREVAWLEVALHALRGTRLSPSERLSTATLVSGYVRQSTLLQQDLTASQAGGGDAGNAVGHWRYLPWLLDPSQHPELLTILGALATAEPHPPGAPAHDQAPTDDDFGYGLERILDGIAAVA